MNKLRFLTAGESHGPALTAIIEGLPAGLNLNLTDINSELYRRQQGFGRGGRMTIEQDTVKVLSGIRFGKTLGSPVTLLIENRDWENRCQEMAVFGSPIGPILSAPRPGHADYCGMLKYNHGDIRNVLERASARETTARVAVGAIAKQLLAVFDIRLISHVTNIGGVAISKEPVDYDLVTARRDNEFGCIDPAAAEKMRQAIIAARQNKDTLGGAFEIITTPVMPGLGSHTHWDRRLDAQLAAAVMSIPAIKGVEIGDGFEYAGLPGSKAHDEFIIKDDIIDRTSNHAGGLEGGMTNGQAVVLRAVMKPIPTLMQPLASVDMITHRPVPAVSERSDVCAVPAAAVVAEAMVAIVLAQALLDKFSGDCLADLQQAVVDYRQRLGR